MNFFESTKQTPKNKLVLVDIDETICFYSKKRRYDLAEPSYENIAKINKLYDNDWKVVYWTSRGGVSGVDYEDFTKMQLEEWGCKYHELSVGEKPDYHLLICDRTKRIEEI